MKLLSVVKQENLRPQKPVVIDHGKYTGFVFLDAIQKRMRCSNFNCNIV
jgi:hypothetical protein